VENETQNLFSLPSQVSADCRLVERALRAGWLNPERRAALQKKVWEKCEECADAEVVVAVIDGKEITGDKLKEFHALAVLLEKMYEFDVKLAEREEARELKRGLPATQNAKAVIVVETGGTVEQQRQRLMDRIRTARGAGGNP
jgi:hypothetical protein